MSQAPSGSKMQVLPAPNCNGQQGVDVSGDAKVPIYGGSWPVLITGKANFWRDKTADLSSAGVEIPTLGRFVDICLCGCKKLGWSGIG
ncbi:hypothetical protein PS623_00968 [Pseudomonas fluorescens]|uniref:hypothetical protein n=1 Tax=Pseudomonas fluorescens TaxID=294 RepID=UPI001240D159|nr:hypothetical protein [Pseudomonas fluorescens]VVM55123.1 hypothetical protein PS623_00968 [Pseudomonas fluorescens]